MSKTRSSVFLSSRQKFHSRNERISRKLRGYQDQLSIVSAKKAAYKTQSEKVEGELENMTRAFEAVQKDAQRWGSGSRSSSCDDGPMLFPEDVDLYANLHDLPSAHYIVTRRDLTVMSQDYTTTTTSCPMSSTTWDTMWSWCSPET